MSQTGKIQYAVQDNVYILRFEGDVRFSQCAAVSRFLKQVFDAQTANLIMLDLTAATGIDSTALGVMAQVANYMRAQHAEKAPLIVEDGDLIALLKSVRFNDVFHMMTSNPLSALTFQVVNEPACQSEVLDTILAAHQALSEVSCEQHDAFKDLADDAVQKVATKSVTEPA